MLFEASSTAMLLTTVHLGVSEKQAHVSALTKCGCGWRANFESSPRLPIVFYIYATFAAYAKYYAKNKTQARKALEPQIHSKCKIPIIKA